MMISGPTMHRQLMDGYREAQLRLEEMRSDIDSIEVRRGELDNDRSDALVHLAEHYLPELTHESIRDSWIEVREKVSQILLRKDGHRSRVQTLLSEINDKRRLLEDRLLEINAALEDASQTQDELAKKAESELASDQAFVTLSGRAAVAEAALERAEANLNEIEQDAVTKLPAYRDSSLFEYLKKRKYGTDQYTKRGFTRRMDRWVAKFIDFPKAKQNYDFLVNTPQQMRKIIADDREALDTVMNELETRRDSVAESLGLTAAAKRFDELMARREEQLKQLDEVQTETTELEAELTDLDDTRGSYYREAVSVFREMLTQFDVHDLESRASRTPSPTDDQIVARIVGVEEKLDDLDHASRRHHEDVVEMQGCIDALGRLMQRFRAAQFDASRSQFVAQTDALDELRRAKSEQDVDAVWEKLRRDQRWGPTLGDQVTGVATHPASQILVGAMAHAAGAAMRDHARRAGRRRYRGVRRNGPWTEESSDDDRPPRRW